MKRVEYRWTVHNEHSEIVGQGVRFAHNSALNAAIGCVRDVACSQRTLYRRGRCTVGGLLWTPENALFAGDTRSLRVTVHAPGGES